MYQHRFCGITHLIKTDLFYLACTFTTLVLKTGQNIYYTLKRKKISSVLFTGPKVRHLPQRCNRTRTVISQKHPFVGGTQLLIFPLLLIIL